MNLGEIIAALGGSAVFGWIAKAFMSREKRLATEAEARSREADVTGETDVAALRAMEKAMERFANMSNADRDRLFTQQIAHMECLAKCEHLQTRLDALEAEHNGYPERISRLETALHAMSKVLITHGLLPSLEEPAE